jgi:3-oxoacyl-[acyl-carrier-protein] synthase-3
MRSVVASTGRYLPERVVCNADLHQFPRTAIPLIEAKTGVRERRHAEISECTSDLATHAARSCLERASIAATDIDGIILSTSSPDRPQPATATRVQALIGATRAFAMDINAVCSGAVYALHLADGLIRSGLHRRILVVASEVYSRILNPRDFSTYPYFGDGAGAALLAASADAGVLASTLKCDGAKADVIQIPAGGSILPYRDAQDPDDQYFKMRGKDVFEFAVSKGAEVILEVLEAAGVSVGQVDCFITHQANINIINKIAEALSIPPERFVVNLDRYGNTASASVLIALDEARRNGALSGGGYCVIAAFGGGLSWGASVVRFGQA